MPSTVLEITNARRAFADRHALRDVSLSVAAGETVALLGPNGAGKTTLIRAIAGRLKLDTGRVLVTGCDPLSDRAARHALGIVPQSIALYPQLTARQNLDVLARLSGVKSAAVGGAVDEALGRAGLRDRANDRLATLSGGMQRRLNIVAGTLHRPQLLLLDEPTVGLDLHARESIHTLLRALGDIGIAIVFSTHDFDQAAAVADRAAFMANGRLLQEGPVAELITRFFGDAKEAIVALSQPAAPSTQQILQSWGLSAGENSELWSGPLRGGYAELAQLENQLAQAGARVAEIRLREPGLGGVFRRLMESGQNND